MALILTFSSYGNIIATKTHDKLGLSCVKLSKLKLHTHQLTNLALLSSSELSWGSQLRRAKNKLFWVGGLAGEAGNKTNSGLLSWGLAELPTQPCLAQVS